MFYELESTRSLTVFTTAINHRTCSSTR